MICDTTPATGAPIAAARVSFAEQAALAAGFKFSAETHGRVQLIDPRGMPCGNFADRLTAALAANHRP